MLRLIFLLVISLYLFSTLLPQIDLNHILSILCFVIVLSTIWQAKRFVQILGGTFLLIGMTLLWSSGAQWQQYIFSFGPMLDLLTMFILIPILGIPIKLGHYGGEIQRIIKHKVKNSGRLYVITSSISYFFSIFMNLATLPMTYYSIRPSLDFFSVQHKEQFMSTAITRGFAMPLLWAPVTPIVGIVIGVTGVSWISILPYVVPVSLLGLGMDWYIGTRKARKFNATHPIAPTTTDETAATIESNPVNRRFKLMDILLAILLFIIVISITESLFHYSFLVLVSLVVIPFSLIWALLIKKGREFGSHLAEHIMTFSVNMKDQFFIYLSAGFLISTINISHSNEVLHDWILVFIDHAGVEMFLILLPLIPLLFAFLGLHPAVSLALMVEGLNPAALGINAHILTVAMLTGAIAAFLVGPFNATLGLMSNLTKVSSYKVSNWNISFTCLYIACVMVYLFILQVFLP